MTAPTSVCDYDDEIEQIASTLARRNRHVEHDDVSQELYAWWFDGRNFDAIRRYKQGGEEGRKKLTRALWNAGGSYCKVEKARQSGYSPEDDYFYSRRQIEELLPLALSPEETALASRKTAEGRGSGDPAEGGNFLAMVADVKRVVDALSASDQAQLVGALATDEDWSLLAANYALFGHEIQPASVARNYQRVVNRIHRRLGGRKPDGHEQYIGTRRVVSNATAIARTRAGEEG